LVPGWDVTNDERRDDAPQREKHVADVGREGVTAPSQLIRVAGSMAMTFL
jgi:hypothetical protein